MSNPILTTYLESALAQAEFDKLEDGSFVGHIPICKGVIVFSSSPRECAEELQSSLEDWLLLGLKLKHQLPIIDHCE